MQGVTEWQINWVMVSRLRKGWKTKTKKSNPILDNTEPPLSWSFSGYRFSLTVNLFLCHSFRKALNNFRWSYIRHSTLVPVYFLRAEDVRISGQDDHNKQGSAWCFAIRRSIRLLFWVCWFYYNTNITTSFTTMNQVVPNEH
jgi:hypothetical protein